VAEFRPHVPAVRKAGADLVVVGSGWPAAAQHFREQLGMSDVTVVCDKDLASYRLAGFRRSVWSILDVRALVAGVRALFRGFFQGRTQGDALQVGGVLLVEPGGNVRYRYASRFAGDHPRPAKVVARLTGLPAT
jgi:hypothetical protein